MAKSVTTVAVSLERSFMNRVYAWMTFALILTAVAAIYVVSSPSLTSAIFGNQLLLIGLVVIELIMVGSLAGAIGRMSLSTASAVFVGYSLLNGVTLSGLLLVYTGSSVGLAFMVSALTFGAMTIYGFRTHADLTELGKLAFMGLIGIIIASVVNLFLHSPAIDWIVSYIGVGVFIGLTAYDTQKLKMMVREMEGDESALQKYAILGALTLYLDFINLFIMILRILGNRRD
jgi:FtsH-binding integral membrane protein